LRSAPPLQITLTADRPWLVFVTSLCLCTMGIVSLWLHSHWPFRTHQQAALCLLVWVAAAALSLRAWKQRRSPTGLLRWDAQNWWYRGQAGQVTVMLDLGRWLLLRFDPLTGEPTPAQTPARVHWFPVSRSTLSEHWHSLRCAVYSPRPAATRLHDR